MNAKKKQPLEELLAAPGKPETAARAMEAVSGMLPLAGFLTVTSGRAQLNTVSGEAVKMFAQYTGLDEFGARQRLSCPVARPLRRDETERESAKWVKLLAQQDVKAFTVGEAELEEMEFAVCDALFKDEHHVIAHLGSVAKEIPFMNFACIVCGEVSQSATELRTLDGIGGTFGRESRDLMKSSQFVIDLHLKSQPRALRLLQDTFDFARVFPKESSASSIQIRTVLKMIRKALPQTPVYDQFNVAESILLADAAEKTAVTNELLRRGVGSGMTVAKTTRVEKNNFRLFDLYSALAHFEALRSR